MLPLLLSFEGADGSGKTTQIRLLARALAAAGHEPLAVREPGGTPLSERIRDLLLDPAAAIEPRAELLLFSAARAQLVETAIRPALAAGRPVLCDRFFDSTTAYQGAGRGLADPAWLDAFHRFVTGGLVPHRTFLLDVPPELAAERRGAARDRMEAAGDGFFERVRQGYHRLAEAEPERVRLLDGTASEAALHAAILSDVQALAEALGHGTAAAALG